MLVQTLNAIARRFQNRRTGRTGATRWPSSRSIRCARSSNLLWGYVQDEPPAHRAPPRLRVRPPVRPDAATAGRSRELRSRPTAARSSSRRSTTCSTWPRVLQGGRRHHGHRRRLPAAERAAGDHLLLAEGAHNQFGDLPSDGAGRDADQQWLLARPEMRDFLAAGHGPVQGALDGPGRHDEDAAGLDGHQRHALPRPGRFRRADPAVHPLRRLDRRSTTRTAANWARYWRPEIQSYMHAYRAATGWT